MNKTMEAAIRKHGEDLQAIFGLTGDPVKLCKRLRQLEYVGHQLGMRYCNGPELTERKLEQLTRDLLADVDRIVGYVAAGVPVFVNLDARGYALKIRSEWIAARRAAGAAVGHKGCVIHCDWGGYGIIAPDLSE